MLTLLRVPALRAFGAGRSSTALPARFAERAPGSLRFSGCKLPALRFRATICPIVLLMGRPARDTKRHNRWVAFPVAPVR
jgi:hypothetical protein